MGERGGLCDTIYRIHMWICNNRGGRELDTKFSDYGFDLRIDLCHCFRDENQHRYFHGRGN